MRVKRGAGAAFISTIVLAAQLSHCGRIRYQLSERSDSDAGPLSIGGAGAGGTGGAAGTAGAGSGVLAAPDAGLPPQDASASTDAAGTGDASGVQTPIDEPGLIGFWRLDESSGLAASDATIYGNHGALTNFDMPTWLAGHTDGALEFDGVDDYVLVAPSASIDSIADTDALTIAAWIYYDATPNKWFPVLTRQYMTTDNEHYGLYIKEARVHLMLNTDTQEYVCQSAPLIPFNRWVHVAVTYDGTTGRGYFEGNEVCSGTPVNPDQRPTTNPVVIGSNVNTAGALEALKGRLDEVRLYSRALSAQEVSDLAAQ